MCAGRVRLNGSVQRDPEKPVRLDSDRIVVDEHEATLEKKIYLMMNKPRGLVTTASDEKGRETVYSVLAGVANLCRGLRRSAALIRRVKDCCC